MLITASIVLYNPDYDVLIKAIQSYNPSPKRKLFLIDNSPSPVDVNQIVSEYLDTEYIFNLRNMGYGSAHNIALEKAAEINSQYHLILNPDIRFNDNVIPELIRFMEEDKSVVYMLPKVIYPDGKLQYLCKLLPTPFDLFFRRFLLNNFLIRKWNDNYVLKESGYLNIMNPPCLSGCFMLLRMSTVKENIVRFDDQFFMYLEDFDIIRRLHRLGKTIYYPFVTIIHDHAHESYQNTKLLLVHIKSTIKYFNKYGWFFDKERKHFNRQIKEEIKVVRKQNKTIVISTNTAWYAYVFRLPLIKVLQAEGYRVAVVAPGDEYVVRLQEAGCIVLPVALINRSTNPLTELVTVNSYIKIYQNLRPDVILNFTPKPTIYGSIAAQLLRIPCVNNITGLGTAFARNDLLSFIVQKMYRYSQRSVSRVFFQNPDDKKLFIKNKIVTEEQSDLLPGSGVELERFVPVEAKADGIITFLLIARLIWYKGVGDYADAARIIRNKYPQSRFVLLGYVDSNTANAVPETQIREWEKEGILEWVGRQDDVIPFIQEADCVVLPSYYREGTPRTLLEGAAMAKPLIAADSIGCREPVEDGKTGFLCQPKNPANLAEKMERIILMGHEGRIAMGRAGRAKMEKEYDVKIVLGKYLEMVKKLTDKTVLK